MIGEDGIFNKNNPYGYRLNVNHPLIRPHYERFKVKCDTLILSDDQRREFEQLMLEWVERKRQKKEGLTD